MTGTHHLSEAAHTTPGSFWEVLEQCSAHRAQMHSAKFPPGHKEL